MTKKWLDETIVSFYHIVSNLQNFNNLYNNIFSSFKCQNLSMYQDKTNYEIQIHYTYHRIRIFDSNRSLLSFHNVLKKSQFMYRLI